MADERIMRACDFDINVTTLAEYNAGITWGGSIRFFENSRHEAPVMAGAWHSADSGTFLPS